MKKIILSQTSFIGAAAFIIVLFSSIFIYAFSTGIDGRTLKSTAIGCSCHASALDPGVIVFISGPDTVITGQTATYTIEVSESSKSGAGIDVSTRNGVLGVIDAQTHLSNGEVVQSSNIPMTNHAVIIQFSYTAPGFATTDTIWATGLATNSNGSLNNDIWNWAPSKRVNVRPPLGIQNISSELPAKCKLEQNYPNPFNPTTNIKFAITKSGNVNMAIYDINGRKVEELVNGSYSAGTYQVDWNAARYSSGVYFYTIVTNEYSDTKRMLLVK